MRGQQLSEMEEKKPVPVDGDASMKELWAAAAKAFESICGESLQKGEVKSFEDVQRKIESSGKASLGTAEGPEDNWNKAKNVGLTSLKYLKMLVGAATQAASLVPIPEAAANITGTALCFVFDIPQAIKGYNDAINQVFGEVSSALAQFQIYRSMDNVDPLLIQQIHLVLTSFVKVCAHVVKYRQGRKRDRFLQQFKSIFDDDSGLADEMAMFKQALQGQRDVEGTITLAVVVETQQDIALMLEKFIVFGKITAETQVIVQDTHKSVQALKNDSDRTKTLVNIRDVLGVSQTVRLDTNTTQWCTNICDKCIDGTGSWIWTHEAYIAWTTPKDNETSNILIVSGPASSGKSSISALITKRLEEQRGRTYVAHYFFPSSTKKSEEGKNPVQSALKYMAFQIARVDPFVEKRLGKACDAGSAAFRRSSSPENLDKLLGELKIGVHGSGATYYLVFDGIENLPAKEAKTLLEFIRNSRPAEGAAKRVRFLVSGKDDQFDDEQGIESMLRIRVNENNGPDMRIVIEEVLSKQGILQNVKNNSEQQKAKDKIIEKLPRNVEGSYSLLYFGLDRVIRVLSKRTAAQELDHILDQSMSSHEAAIENMQRSLTADEITELNELLKWVIFAYNYLSLEQLEAVMWLYTGIASLTPLEYIIKNKYSAVLKLEDSYVDVQDRVLEYFREKNKDSLGRSSLSKDHATISMNITINNVDQELCGHFLWDLADMAIRDKFKFNFNSDGSNALHSSSQGTVTVDEFEANHTIVTRTFEYLDMEPSEQSKGIGGYLLEFLPFHLGQLRELEDDDKGALAPHKQSKIGQDLCKLFRDDVILNRHKATFEQVYWTAAEIKVVQKWFMDSAVVRKVDKKWRDEMQSAITPIKGYLRGLVKMVVSGLLRDRSWGVENAYRWLKEFIAADKEKVEQSNNLSDANPDDPNPDGSSSPDSIGPNNDIDWDHLSIWCQGVLGLSDSEIDSLWYERLAEASSLLGNDLDRTVSFYRRAIEQKDPSWLCHRGLGIAYFNQERITEAITQVELALTESEQEDATPKPDVKDVIGLHLMLGDYAYHAGNMATAAKHYSYVCASNDEEQATQGLLGHIKAKLGSPDAEDARQFLKSILAEEGGEKGRMVSVLRMLAQDPNHDDIVSYMFTTAKGDPDLLRGIVHTMRTAAARPVPFEDHVAEALGEDDRYSQDVTRGVLLYDLGVAAYTYKVSPDGTEPVNEALKLWMETREVLANVGGSNASVAQMNATLALANHYFQSMVDGSHQEYLEPLAKLAEDNLGIYGAESAMLLGVLHTLHGKKEKAREVLTRQVKQALQILSDDTPENDAWGFAAIFAASERCQDWENAIIALSLMGQQDLVTEALRFEISDIEDTDSEDKQQMLDMVMKLAQETVQVVKTRVPDIKKQHERMKVAKAHIDSLIAASEKANVLKSATSVAHHLLQTRLSKLIQFHTPEINGKDFQWSWTCDGINLDGKKCKNVTNFERGFYHCTYCSNQDFCRDCFGRLRDPESDMISICNAKHQWLIVPCHGDDMFVGVKAKSVRVPHGVKTVDGDKQVLMAYFAEDGTGKEIEVEAWKEKIAREWGVSLKDDQGEKDKVDEE
ncbi:hypothetical protein F4810DRAFT_691137 [Camillea tinctor]|nr:hypothetical protein F4810DRAFT_691137 [Camillea tinctor]